MDDPGVVYVGGADGISSLEFDAGPDHVIVLYQPPDTGAELEPALIFSVIAADAAERASTGLRLLSMTAMPLRHAGVAFGGQGSGYETKGAIAVLYERWPAVKD